LNTTGTFVWTMDWIGFSYAATIILGGYMGYKRKGSVMSMMAGLVFGAFSAYGAYNISNNPKDIQVSFPCSRHGNEIQEIWEINACWYNVRAKFANGIPPAAPDHGVKPRIV
uniref:Transmembrane protein 14A n=1 Tax=Oryzias sinensis TaxID=183150 RepID=A0A8C7XWC4_9TELE